MGKPARPSQVRTDFADTAPHPVLRSGRQTQPKLRMFDNTSQP